MKKTSVIVFLLTLLIGSFTVSCIGNDKNNVVNETKAVPIVDQVTPKPQQAPEQVLQETAPKTVVQVTPKPQQAPEQVQQKNGTTEVGADTIAHTKGFFS